MISYNEAYHLTIDNIQVLGVENVDILKAVGRTAAEDMFSRVNSPSADASLKDGYAVHAADVLNASESHPVVLRLVGSVSAGGHYERYVNPGCAVRVLSGAPIPPGTDAVVAEEFTKNDQSQVIVKIHAESGRNILPKGNDVACGQKILSKNVHLSAATAGFLAAAGYKQVPVYSNPRVAILATGDEVIAPGKLLVPGKLYASNLVTLAAWCNYFGFDIRTLVVDDDKALIRDSLIECLLQNDALLTSGGAWKGDRDYVVQLLDELGWEKIYHRVRIGPGKGIGFGIYQGKPVFCLPGGPPSNHSAFLQLALPGLQKFAGQPPVGLPRRMVHLAKTVSGQIDWTQFIHGFIEETDDQLLFYPEKMKSRLQMMAQADAIIAIPEGQDRILEGSVIQACVLRNDWKVVSGIHNNLFS